MYDFVIIGGGVVGCAIARTLSQYDCRVALLEKEKDVSLGASKANSGIVHGGYAGQYGTLKGELCIKGNAMYDVLEEMLHFGFKRIGGMILGFDERDKTVLEAIFDNGVKVGQKDIVWLSKQEILEKEPSVSDDVYCGLWMPSIGITSPYELTIALIENAVMNGVSLFLEHEVNAIHYDEYFQIQTSKGDFHSKFIINAAGLASGFINRCLGHEGLTIHPRRGQYVVFSKQQNHIHHVLFQTPSEKGKGVLVTPTVHGNLMIGPDAEDLFEDVTTSTSLETIQWLFDTAKKTYNGFEEKGALTTFSGIRAMSTSKDFFIDYVHDFAITVGGIDSPGLTSAPAIANYVLELILNKQELLKKRDFNPNRNSYFDEDNDQLICLCEKQGENRIRRALNGPIQLSSFDAVKRRVRTGMGNCQGRRCYEKVRLMIAEHYDIPLRDIKRRTENHQPKRVALQDIKSLK